MPVPATTTIKFTKHSQPPRTITCGSHSIVPGEGANGPMMLTWWDTAERVGEPAGFAAQVTDYEINPAD